MAAGRGGCGAAQQASPRCRPPTLAAPRRTIQRGGRQAVQLPASADEHALGRLHAHGCRGSDWGHASGSRSRNEQGAQTCAVCRRTCDRQPDLEGHRVLFQRQVNALLHASAPGILLSNKGSGMAASASRPTSQPTAALTHATHQPAAQDALPLRHQQRGGRPNLGAATCQHKAKVSSGSSLARQAGGQQQD